MLRIELILFSCCYRHLVILLKFTEGNRMKSQYSIGFAFFLFVSNLISAPSALGQSAPPSKPPASWGPISINMEEIDYPYPISYFNFSIYGEDVRIAYMDVAPSGQPNGRTVIFHHGGLYYGWYWAKQIES